MSGIQATRSAYVHTNSEADNTTHAAKNAYCAFSVVQQNRYQNSWAVMYECMHHLKVRIDENTSCAVVVFLHDTFKKSSMWI